MNEIPKSYQNLDKIVTNQAEINFKKKNKLSQIFIFLFMIPILFLIVTYAVNQEKIINYFFQYTTVKIIYIISIFVFFIYLIFTTIRRLIKYLSVFFWKRTYAKLLFKKITQNSSIPYTFYKPTFIYEYEVNNEKYISENYTINDDSFIFRFISKIIINNFEIDRRYKIFYNSKNPKLSVFSNNGILNILIRLISLISIYYVFHSVIVGK